ncbi:MAG: helix-turn-helix domain-containing protein [bacterium]
MNHPKKRKLTFNQIVEFVCNFYDISEKEIVNPNRRKDVVKARQIIIYLIRKILNKSYPFIGRRIGGRDHTTILYSYNKIKKEIKRNKELKKDIIDIISSIINDLGIIFKIKGRDESTKKKFKFKKKDKNSNFEEILEFVISRGGGRVKTCKKVKGQLTIIKSIKDISKLKLEPRLFIRQDNILQKYKEGWTLKEIGTRYKLTRQRIQQIVERGLVHSSREILKQGIELDLSEFLKEEKSKHTLLVWKKHGIIKKEIYKREKRWSRYYDNCRECRTVAFKHRSHGYCKKCYPKTKIFKEQQESSRLRNKEKISKHVREYFKRPEVIAKMKRKSDLKYFGGNREKSIVRDRERCRKCGLSRKENNNRHNEDLRVIHVNDKKDNSLDNLLTLCKECFYKELHRRRN